MRKLFAFFLIVCLCVVTFANETNWFKGTFEEAKGTASKEGKLILIHFFSPN